MHVDHHFQVAIMLHSNIHNKQCHPSHYYRSTLGEIRTIPFKNYVRGGW